MVPRNYPSIKISKFSEIDVIVKYFQSHPREYDSTVESWMEDILQRTDYLEYYQRRMKRTIDSYIPINNHCYMLGKEAKVNAKIGKLRALTVRLEEILNVHSERDTTSTRYKYHVLKLHQPVASLVVSGLVKTIRTDGLPNISEGEIVFVFAETATSKSTRGLLANEMIYGTYHNARSMGTIEEYADMPKECYIGFVKVGQRMTNGLYVIREAFAFEKQVMNISNGINSSKHSKLDKPKISYENGKLRVPLCKSLWEQMESSDGHFYLYWKTEFDNFYSPKYGLGNEEGLYDIIFVRGADEKRFKQNDIDAVTKQEFISSSNEMKFWALVVNFEKLSPKKKYEDSSFSIMRKQEWILDWKCVKFKNGYFVVVPPVDESVKFKPEAISKPGVIESYNYLKEYLNDRLAPVRCSVEELKLTIYDTIRLDEAIAKFATVSKQRAIRSSGTSNARISPQQMSFKQALSKAQKMTAEEFEKYKSEYINHLVKLQSKKYKVIPCVERLSHANNDVTEFAFMFSIECRSGSILIVHENVNPDRSTLLFWVKEAAYDKAIREIYDFLQSAEINKRSSLRGGSIDVGNVGVIRYKSINHDDIWSWKKSMKVYTVGYYINI
jgi:hypothetical protein